MYNFNFSDCSFYWTLHLYSPSTKHTGSRLGLQIFYFRLFVVSWTTTCICTVLPKQKCRPHIYTSPKDIQKFSVSNDITLNATWLYMFNKQWTLYSKLSSKSTYFKFYDFVLHLKVKIIHSEKGFIKGLSLFLTFCCHHRSSC